MTATGSGPWSAVCSSSLPVVSDGYPEFGYHLNKTGRPMVYSCSWPVYQIYAGMAPNFTSIIQHCNMWRNFDDIQDTWVSVESIIDYYGNNQDTIVPNAGPGHWNDPDMLIIGNFGLSYEQSKTQMALWAILAAPLLMSVDLRTIRPEYKAILQNKKIIAVDQDPLGYQGRRIYKHNGIEIWARPITPFYQTYFSYAVLFLNRRTDGTPSDVAVTLRELGLSYPGGYNVEDLYEDVNYGVLTPQTKIKVKVNPSGVVILRADIQPQFEVSRQLQTPYDPYNQIFQWKIKVRRGCSGLLLKVVVVYSRRNGCDSLVRLKTALGEMIKPIQRVFSLEIIAPTRESDVKVLLPTRNSDDVIFIKYMCWSLLNACAQRRKCDSSWGRSSRQAFIEGLSTGLKPPRACDHALRWFTLEMSLALLKVLSERFCAKKTADAHDQIDDDVYENWFSEQLLPNSPEGVVIVIDNAAYHSRSNELRTTEES
uniref:Alpha-galactosidase n=1 Tax=Timema cristinae TaxID=61476 RepID=A0A7R9H3T6_TIMCR|nr:unnamed protein product [Timema cristinae]